MLFKIIIDLLFGFFDIILFMIPPLPVWNNIETALNSLSWMYSTFAYGFNALGYIAGDNFLVLLPIIVNVFLIPVEITISFLWLFLHKTHIAGAGGD